MDRSQIHGMPRDKYVERCKQRAFDHLDQGDLSNAVVSFVSDMNACPDCRLPHHLAELGALLLMGDDALGWRTLIEGFRLCQRLLGELGQSKLAEGLGRTFLGACSSSSSRN